MLQSLRRAVGWRARAALQLARASLTPRSAALARFRQAYFADVPVDLDRILHYKVERFPDSGPRPWLDRPDAEIEISRRERAGEITAGEAQRCREWSRRGFFVLERFFEPARLDAVWEAYEAAVRDGRVVLQPEPPDPSDPHPSRSLDAHLTVAPIDSLLHDAGLARWMGLLLGREAVPFQTLVAHKGSEQREHSDAIHMTTYPLGYLTAAWIACEDIAAGCGPVVYYPGSHRLPYLSSLALGIPPDDFRRRGYAAYFEKYEPAIRQAIERENLAAETFLARKGDVLLWHGNLIHAGSPRRDKTLSRKSVVLHYFARGAVCYHDLSGTMTPANRLGR